MNCVVTYFKDHDEADEPNAMVEIEVVVEGEPNRKAVQEANDKADAIMRQRGLDPEDYPDVDVNMGQPIKWENNP